MKQSFIKPILQLLLVCILVAFFGVLYSITTLSLPLFGDATIHGANALDVLTKGWRGLEAEYPAFYSYVMAILFPFFGEKGFNLVPFTGFIFLLISTFLFIRQLTKNYYLGLLAIIFVGASPKIIFYSTRMYQEILIGGFFIFCMYLLFKYLEERQRIFLFLLAFFVGITLSIKQQGLFILYPAMVIFFIVELFKNLTSQIVNKSKTVSRNKESGIRNYELWSLIPNSLFIILLISILPLLIGFGFYGVLFHTTGKLVPGNEEFSLMKSINTVGETLFAYSQKNEEQTNLQLEQALTDIETTYSHLAFKRAEERHILPTDVFTNFDKFNQANNLYVPFQGITGNLFIILALCAGLIGGLLYCIFNYKQYHHLLLFSAIFLPINYLLFVRNTDQQRYHLFLPIFLLAFVLLFFQFLYRRLQIPPTTTVVILCALVLLLFLPPLIPRILLNTRWGNSQLYSPSVGGIAAIREAGQWMHSNSAPTTIVGQQCNNETHYYFKRPVSGDWRVYFLDEKNLDTYFREKNIAYYVIYTSQVVEDNEWKIICWVPKSFYERIEKQYERAYTTKSGDVIIYKL